MDSLWAPIKNGTLCQVLRAVMTISKGVGFFSSSVFQQAILKHYQDSKLIPRGMQIMMECVQKWALKMGLALRRMVPCMVGLNRIIFWLGSLAVAIFSVWDKSSWIHLNYCVGPSCQQIEASAFRRNYKRAATSKLANLNRLKQELLDVVDPGLYICIYIYICVCVWVSLLTSQLCFAKLVVR